ncbi:hypothetical protein AGOR_G00210330 [Albula goreensis]|uniref:Ig-like domain-containing protein n=1 Tax=Albula goreensis TaxID=1534307 RepID=A0A8T3CLS2_9TELE|nr:hypothetical protein AGOR_G00210330 [Albula goreensis]
MKYSIFTAVLLGAFCVLAKVEAHIDIWYAACVTNDTNTEDELQLDGDELFYTDFKNKDLVYTQPDFVDKIIFPTWLQSALGQQQVCINNLNVAVISEKNPPEEVDSPQSTIYPRNKVVLGRSNTLICFVNNFHPPPIKVKWTKNDVEVKEGVTLSRYYPNRDFTLHQMSTLSIVPEEGDIYSCTVEHKGLQEPLTRMWELEVQNQSNMGATAFCGIGLTLGLLGVGVGTFFLIKGNHCN